MMAAVRSVTTACADAASISPVSGSTSQNTGIAPACTAASADDMTVWPGTIASSPLPIPAATRASVNAAVPEAIAHTVRDMAVVGELVLEGFYLGPQDERVRRKDSIEGPMEIVGERPVLAPESDQRDLDFPRFRGHFGRSLERLGRKTRARRFKCRTRSRRIHRSSVAKRSSC
jgi:hypothetical protein